MAFRTPNIPGNLWGQGTRGTRLPREMIMNTIFTQKELEFRRTKMLTDIVESLNPIEFLNDQLMATQAEDIKKFED